MAVWLSTGAFRTRELPTLLAEAKAHGIRGLELSSGMDYSPGVIEQVRQARRAGEQDFLVHNYFPAPAEPFVLNVAAQDEESHRATRRFAEQAIDLAHEVGAPFYSIHAGFAAALRPELLGRPEALAVALSTTAVDRDGAYGVMIEMVRHLADHAASRGLGLLLENNVASKKLLDRVPVNPLLLVEGREIATFFAHIDRDNVGLLLDLAHAKVSAQALGFDPHAMVETVAPFVRCLHLSDNDGLEDSNMPVRGDSWFMPFLKDFRDSEIVIEVCRLDAETMKSQLDLVQQAIK